MFDVRLIAARELSGNVRELTFEAGAEFEFEPGQWVNLYFPGHRNPSGEVVKHAYSIASAPSKNGRFDLVVARENGGLGGALLHAAHEGETFPTTGPFGAFLMAPMKRPILMVATGSGVAPFRAMLQASAAQARMPMALLFGNRDESELLYRAEFEALARTNVFFAFYPTLSRPHSSWKGLRGYVQLHLPEILNSLRSPDCDVYICGQPSMVKDVRRLLQEELSVEPKRVHVERFG